MGVTHKPNIALPKKWKGIRDISFALIISLLAGSAAASLATVITSTRYPFLSGLVALFVLIAMLPVIYRLLTNTFDTFEAENVVILFYSLYSLSVPLHLLFSPDATTEQLRLSTQALELCLLGLLFFLVGYHNRLGNALAQIVPTLPPRWKLKKLRYIGRCYLLLGIALFLGLVGIVGISTYFRAGYAGRALLKLEFGPLELGLYVFQIGLLLYCFYYFLVRKRPSFWIIALYSLYVLLVLQVGIRRPLLGLLLASFAAWHYLVKKIPFTKAVLIAIIFGILLVLFAFVRQPIASYGFAAGIKHLIDNFEWSWFDLSRTEFGAPFKNLLDILEIVPDREGYLYGSSYWQSIENLLPRFMYPSRPLTLSEWYTKTFFSEEFVRAGGNMGFFIVSEAYINWGVIGVMIVMFSWGTLLKALYAYMRRDLHNTSALFVYSISLAWIVFAMRVDFAATLKGFLITAFLPAMFAIMIITYNPQ